MLLAAACNKVTWNTLLHTGYALIILYGLSGLIFPRRCSNTILALYKTRDFPTLWAGFLLIKKEKRNKFKKHSISILITLIYGFELNGSVDVVYEGSIAACRHL